MKPSKKPTEIFPEKDKFINPFNSRSWLRYFGGLLPRFRYVRFLGITILKDVPDISLDRLYVPLYFGNSYVPIRDIEEAEKYSIQDILEKYRRLIILGDPGSGKSTLINHLTTLFASLKNHLLAASLGNMIPVPIILRDYTITKNMTFDNLLDQFLEQPFSKGEITRDDLTSVMKTGQALIMLDGLDEVGTKEKREGLRNAVLNQGIKKYPSCIWMMTSRIIGYEEVRFDERQTPNVDFEIAPRRNDDIEPPEPLNLLYLLPFNKEQIRAFIERWYAFREADKSSREQGVQSLLDAISKSRSIEELSHTPNLLTMMALVHRVYAKLPSGRAELYKRITEAYLESIDALRKLPSESSIPFNKHLLWLSNLAYYMQEQRSEKEKSKEKGHEILVHNEKIKETMKSVIGETYDLDREIGFIARRSGLLLPRKPEFFNFVHLSFQEYFASIYLYENLMDFDERDNTIEKIKELCKNTVWHETLIFLFETLYSHPKQKQSDSVFKRLFVEKTEHSKESIWLIAELIGDLHSGLSPETLKTASNLILNYARFREFDKSLIDRINLLPEEIQENNFLPAIKEFLPSVKESLEKPSSEVQPDFLLFLQNLEFISFSDLDSLLKNTVLSSISDKDLYYLYPLLDIKGGHVYQELIARMPAEYWFYYYSYSYSYLSFSPILFFSDHEIIWNVKQNQDIIIWLGAIESLMNALWLKMIIMSLLKRGGGGSSQEQALALALDRARAQALALALDRAQARARALALDRAQARARALALALDRARARARALALDRARALDRALDRARALARTQAQALALELERALALARTRARARARARAQALARARALALDRALGLERALALALALARTERLPLAMQVVSALLDGDDTFNLPEIQADNTPFKLIFEHLANLVLGKGSAKDWNEIQNQVKIMLDKKWVKKNLDFLKAGEMEIFFKMLGINPNEKTLLFEAKWFEQCHELADAIHAKPGEFKKAVDELVKE